MLAGEAAADLDAELEDGVARFLRLLQFAGFVDVEQDERVQVAVARMEHVGDAQAVARADRADAFQDQRQLPGRDGAVHADVVRDPAGGAEGRFAALPDRRALGLALRDLQARRVEGLRDRDDAGEHVLAFLVGALDLDDEHRLGIARVAGLREILGDQDRLAVHVFHGDRDDAGRDDRRRAGPGILHRGEAEQGWARALRAAQDAHRRLCDDAELPLRAADEAEQVVARGVEMLAADLHHGAVMGDEGDAHEVVGGDPVFQAMRPAGIHRDVARDGAGELARRVGGVEEALVRDGARDGEVGDAGFDPGGPV